MKYRVLVPELWYREIIIEADNPTHAQYMTREYITDNLTDDSIIELDDLIYSETLTKQDIIVEEVKND
jgi:hypothetical protein